MNDIGDPDTVDKFRHFLCASCKSLRMLDLSFNPLGNQGLRSIAIALATHSALETLNVTNCKVDFKGA